MIQYHGNCHNQQGYRYRFQNFLLPLNMTQKAKPYVLACLWKSLGSCLSLKTVYNLSYSVTLSISIHKFKTNFSTFPNFLNLFFRACYFFRARSYILRCFLSFSSLFFIFYCAFYLFSIFFAFFWKLSVYLPMILWVISLINPFLLYLDLAVYLEYFLSP